MLFHYLADPESGAYFEQLRLRLPGDIDVEVFTRAWNEVVQANDALRTLFRWERLEKPLQIILRHQPLKPLYFDFSAKNAGQRTAHLENIEDQDRRKKFDLSAVPFRVTLGKVQTAVYEMIISNHHILYDGWSNGIILQEFFAAYEALSPGAEGEQGHAFPLAKPLKAKFKDFVLWLQHQDRELLENYWQDYLRGFDTPNTPHSQKKTAGRQDPGNGKISVSCRQGCKRGIAVFSREA